MDTKQGETVVSPPPQGEDKIKAVSLRRKERVLKAWDMHETGATTAEISNYFGISQRMVQLDLKMAPKLLKDAVTTQDGGEILGGEIAFWRQVVRQAMRDYQMAQSENAKIGFLRVATEARAKLQKLYLDVGLLVAVPTRIAIEEGNPFIDSEFRKKYYNLLKEARAKGLQINGI